MRIVYVYRSSSIDRHDSVALYNTHRPYRRTRTLKKATRPRSFAGTSLAQPKLPGRSSSESPSTGRGNRRPATALATAYSHSMLARQHHQIHCRDSNARAPRQGSAPTSTLRLRNGAERAVASSGRAGEKSAALSPSVLRTLLRGSEKKSRSRLSTAAPTYLHGEHRHTLSKPFPLDPNHKRRGRELAGRRTPPAGRLGERQTLKLRL